MNSGIALVFATLLTACVQAETIPVSQFDHEGLKGWTEKSFSGNTQYTLIKREGSQVLMAESKSAASALYKKVRIDLEITPYLNWSWLVTKHLGNIDERKKEGDDYPARVYVIIDGGVFFWKTRALNYVWSSYQPKGTTWPNAYSDNARMLALQSGNVKIGDWVPEKRNIRDDFKKLFGEDLRFIDGIAVMTDTDNSQGRAVTFYRHLFFSSD
ncbi:hypothetical protein A9Q88_05210 [Gammaproteobacteria bacterium 50_400_T64]|nr:hypothetical protein A9Q88_05210 [Gammaproteobacteria bacterium 50_400_T64]